MAKDVDETWAWYARAAGSARRAVGSLRALPDVEAAQVGDGPEGRLWLRGRAADPEVLRALAMAGAEVFAPGAERGLVPAHPPGRRVPTAHAPDADWRAIADVVPVRVEPAALAGTVPPPVELRVARGGPPREPAALRVPLARLLDWIDLAPAARFESLVFAADASGEALVLGEPLPPLEGTLYWEGAGVLIPCGHRLDPDVDAATARAVLAGKREDDADDRYLVETAGVSRVPASSWVRMSRSAVRATAASTETP
ncbi:MAG: hypothetical protein AAGB93_00245 [Planctomycetota bacterium]